MLCGHVAKLSSEHFFYSHRSVLSGFLLKRVVNTETKTFKMLRTRSCECSAVNRTSVSLPLKALPNVTHRINSLSYSFTVIFLLCHAWLFRTTKADPNASGIHPPSASPSQQNCQLQGHSAAARWGLCVLHIVPLWSFPPVLFVWVLPCEKATGIGYT